MFRTCLPILLSGFVLAVGLPSVAAQGSDGELHEFTDKTGKKILAELLAVSEDRRTMRIRREDGQVFQSEIVALSLDDQQFIKDWMESRPDDAAIMPAEIDYRLEMEIAKKALGTERHTYRSYDLEQKMQNFAITVTNLSRDSLSGAQVEYVIVWANALDVYLDEDGEWTARFSSSNDFDISQAEVAAISGILPLEEVAFNRDITVTTEEHELNRMMHSSEVYREDEFRGIIARIVDSQGRSLQESRVGSAAIDDLTWDEAVALVPEIDSDDD